MESVVAKDHTSLLKTIEKSELKVVYTFPLKQENHFPLANAICFVQSTALKMKGGATLSSEDENVPSTTKKVMTVFHTVIHESNYIQLLLCRILCLLLLWCFKCLFII